MRKFRFVALALAGLSLICVFFNIIDFVQKKEWVITTAEITFIGLPEGNVYGTFTDIDNVIHENIYMYQDYKFTQVRAFIKGTDPEPYIGTIVKIRYNPNTLIDNHQPDIEKYYPNYISLITLTVSIIFLWACMRKKKIE
ncbi:MAG: hypothetical protein ACI39R_06660 [Lachnospiraceae bacterium]